MKISQLLKEHNSIQTSFLLGMIYARPIILKDKTILAYTSYKKGPRSEDKLKKDINEYYYIHKNKLEKFLGSDYRVILNI